MIEPQQETQTQEQITEKRLGAALRLCKANVPLTATTLNISVARLDNAMRMAKNSKKIAKIFSQYRKDRHQWVPGTLEQIEEDVKRKAILYKHEAMDVLREIALMPMSENAYQNQIKLHAAMKLVDLPGVKLEAHDNEKLAETLRALNEEFNRNAPKLRLIRETITVEMEPQRIGSTIEAEPLPIGD